MADVFQFYSNSASAPAPGKGTGESGDPSKYKELRKHEGWRRILSTFAETAFVWKGLHWKSAEHAYRAWHLETKNPSLFKTYSEELAKPSPIPNEEVLKNILHEKFTQNQEAKEVLQLTGKAELWYAPLKAPKVHWTVLEEIRDHINNLPNTTEMSKVKSKKIKLVPQGGATMPHFAEVPYESANASGNVS